MPSSGLSRCSINFVHRDHRCSKEYTMTRGHGIDSEFQWISRKYHFSSRQSIRPPARGFHQMASRLPRDCWRKNGPARIIFPVADLSVEPIETSPKQLAKGLHLQPRGQTHPLAVGRRLSYQAGSSHHLPGACLSESISGSPLQHSDLAASLYNAHPHPVQKQRTRETVQTSCARSSAA
jgi:hypothetical protein